MSEDKKPRIQSVARAAVILFSIASSDKGMSPKEINQQTKISMQTVYHLLQTLTQTGLVTRNDENRYVLGLSVGSLVTAFGRQLAPPEYLLPHLRTVALETGETAHAAGWWQDEIVSLGVARGHNPIQVIEVPRGYSGDAHARACGKLLLAFAPSSKRTQYFHTHTLRRQTSRTITSIRVLEQEFKQIQERGYSVDREEFAEGLWCLAAPIDCGMSPYALSLSGSAERFSKHFDRYLAALRRAAKNASARNFG